MTRLFVPSDAQATRWAHIGRHAAAATLYTVVAAGLMAPLASNTRLPDAPDHHNHLAMIVQARLAMEDGQFPIRVTPLEHERRMYPVYQFYSPLPYAIAGLLYRWCDPLDLLIVYKLVIWAAFWAAGFFTYLTATFLTRCRPAGVLAGVVYMSAPYLLVNAFARGAFTETVAQGFLPLVVYCSLRACFGVSLGPWLFAAGMSWACLALTHNITFVYGSLFVGLFFAGITWRRHELSVGAWRLVAAYALGLLLALFFLAPLAAADYLEIRRFESVFRLSTLTSLASLLSPISLPSGHSSTPNLNAAIGWPTLLAVLCFVWTYRELPRSIDGLPTRRIGNTLLALFVLAMFLTWSPIDFWSLLPAAASMAQAPYRFLVYVAWTGALLSAFALAPLFVPRPDVRVLAAGVLIIVLAHSSFLPAFTPAHETLDELVRAPHLNYAESAYLAILKPVTPEAGVMSERETRRFCMRFGGGWRCDIPVGERSMVAQLPAFYYPEMLAITVDQRKVPYMPLAVRGQRYLLAGVTLEPGFHTVEAGFRGLAWANAISGAAWLLTLTACLSFAVRLAWSRMTGRSTLTRALVPGADAS